MGVWIVMLVFCFLGLVAPTQLMRLWKTVGIRRTYSDAVIRVWIGLLLLFLVIVLLVTRR